MLQQLGRLLANLLLAYAAAGAIALAMLSLGRVVHPEPEATGVLATWGYGMVWLTLAVPLVAVVLGILDLVLYKVEKQRLVARLVSLVPALLLAPALLVGFEAVPIVGWMLATGLAFGQVVRLPPERAAQQT